jgi:transposase
MPKPFPLEFRRDVVAVARMGEAPLSQIAKDFGISESCLHRWLKLADVDDGVRPGVTSIESAELRELRKRNKTDHPVGDHGNAELADLPRAAGLGDRMLAHRKRAELARLQRPAQIVQEPRHAHGLLDAGDRQAVHAGSVRAVVTRDPAERHDQRRRVVHDVERVIEPAATISRRPTVKLGLHLRYPRPRPRRGRAGSAERLSPIGARPGRQ